MHKSLAACSSSSFARTPMSRSVVACQQDRSDEENVTLLMPDRVGMYEKFGMK